MDAWHRGFDIVDNFSLMIALLVVSWSVNEMGNITFSSMISPVMGLIPD